MFRLAHAAYLILLSLALLSPAGAQQVSVAPVALTGPETKAETILSVGGEQFRDVGGRLTIATAPDADFQPIGRMTADFGYTQDIGWVRVPLRNDTAGISDWRLHFRSNFLPEFAVWQIDPGAAPILRERHVPNTTFGERVVSYPEIVVPIVLPPGAETMVYIRYASGGSTKLSFAVLSAEEFAIRAASRTARNFVYYGMMTFMVAAALLACALTRRTIFASYALYAGSALLYIMHADGNAFNFLWPNAPLFNGYVSVLLGSGIIVFGAVFARLFLQTRRYHPVLNALLLGVIALTLTLVAITAFGGTQTVKKLLVLLAFLSILLFAVSGLVAARKRFREVRFYVIAWIGAFAASGLMTARHWLGLDLSEELQFDAMRIVLVVDAAMMGLAIIDNVAQLRTAQQRSLEQALRETRRNLELNRRLADLERNYAVSIEMANAHQRRLAETAHDLRQPLAALRLNVNRLLNGAATSAPGSGPSPDDFEENFKYLETLVANEISRLDQDAPPPDAPQNEAYRIEDVLTTVVQMFTPTAASAGLRLRHVRSSAMTRLPPLDLMRICSNLIDNAIKYTPDGSILVGVRRVNGTVRLEVHDTGPGMTRDAFDKARGHSARLDHGDGIEGAGLGLSIINDLARLHGLKFELCENRQNGTGIAITLPAVRA